MSSVSETRPDLIAAITEDHRAVERVFAELESGVGDPRHRRDLAEHVVAELVRHSVAEEQYLYPVARRVLEDGDAVADHEISEHAAAERLMKQLESVEPIDPAFDEILGSLISEVRHHVEEEERDLLPRLASACSEDQLRDLGDKVMRAKETAPTRPHPSAPDRPPANLVIAPGAGLIDRIRDRLTGRNN